MRIVILQPSYLPWLGYFDQMFKSDTFVVYDEVQFDKNGWRNRNRIKTPQGAQWLTVPVLTKGRNFPLNREVEINNTLSWQTKHLKSIVQNYMKAPFFDQYMGQVEDILKRAWRFLIDLDMAFIHTLVEHLGLQTKICLSSDLRIPKMEKTERLVAICRYLGADIFLEGDAGRNYVDESLFQKAGINLEFHQYQHPVYHQLYGEFVPYMSIIDLIFNHGEDSLKILTHQKVIQ
jgi:hypothetical protein